MKRLTYGLGLLIILFSLNSYAEEKVILTTLAPVLDAGGVTDSRTPIYASNPNQADLTPQQTQTNALAPGDTFTITVPVTAGQIIRVLFSGNVFGNTHSSIFLVSGGATKNFAQVIDTGQSAQVWHPYTVTALYTATANGNLKFGQQFWRGTYEANISVFSRVATADYFESAEQRGTPP